MTFVLFSGWAQVQKDSVLHLLADTLIMQTDTVDKANILKENSPTIPLLVADTAAVDADTATAKTFKPDPLRSIWLGAAIPGYGQIVNKKYWKLPIVYGGFLGFAYAITWNNNKYVTYKNGYRDIIDNDPNTNYHIKILPRGYTLETYPGGISTYRQRLKTGMEQFRQYRDLSIILAAVYYGVVLLEAYVDAELYDFDIAPELTMRVEPSKFSVKHYAMRHGEASAYGLQCSIRF